MVSFLSILHKNIFLNIHGLVQNNPFLEKISFFIADTIDTYVVIVAVIVLCYLLYDSFEHKNGKKFFLFVEECIQVGFAVGMAYFSSFFIKKIVSAPRPFLRFPDEVNPLFYYGGFDSFPSGHATLFMALGVMIYLHHKKLGTIFIFLAFIIALARVISGIHFPIDILFGWILGASVSYFVYSRIK